MEINNQTVMNLIDILDLSDEVVEKIGALHEILLLVQDDATFLMGGDLSVK